MQNEITEAVIEAACRAHTPQFERMDPTIQTYAREQMRCAISAALTQAAEPVATAVVGGLVWHKFVNVPCDLYTSPPVASPEPVAEDVALSMVDAGMFSDEHEARREIAMAEFMDNRPAPPCDGRAEALDIPLEIAMHAERLYDEGGYKSVPTIIAEAIMAERERWAEAATELADLMDDVVSGNYTPDSFTTQPIRALTQKDKADE